MYKITDDNLSSQKKKDLTVVLCGQAGQGIQTVEYLLTKIFKLADYNIFATKEYKSRIRGGTNSTEIRISSGSVRASVNRIDILVPLDRGAIRHVEKRISPQTVILAEKEAVGDNFNPNRHKFIDVPFKENTCYLAKSHDPYDRNEDFKKATETERLSLGILYVNPDKTTFEENIGIYQENQQPLYERKPDFGALNNLIETFKIND